MPRRLLPDFRGLPRPFWVLFAGTLVNRVGGFVLVFLAIYLTEVRGLSAAEAGAVMSVYGLGAIAGGPLGGALSDRIGRRSTLGASLIGGGASMMVLGLMTGTPAITAAAAVTGLLPGLRHRGRNRLPRPGSWCRWSPLPDRGLRSAVRQRDLTVARGEDLEPFLLRNQFHTP